MLETIKEASKRLKGQDWYEFAMDYQTECLETSKTSNTLPDLETYAKSWKLKTSPIYKRGETITHTEISARFDHAIGRVDGGISDDIPASVIEQIPNWVGSIIEVCQRDRTGEGHLEVLFEDGESAIRARYFLGAPIFGTVRPFKSRQIIGYLPEIKS